MRRSPVIIGREPELDGLNRALLATRAQASSAIFLLGEAGIGKTRLLGEAVAQARRLGLAVLSGRSALTAPTAFGVIAEALRSWLRAHPGERRAPSPYTAGLRLILPEWATGPASQPALSDSQLRLLAFEGLVDLSSRIAAGKGGVLIALDDLHAADAESLEAIRYVATARVPGVLLVGTLRTGESAALEEMVSKLRREGVVDAWKLEPLANHQVGDLLCALLGTEPPGGLVADVVGRTDGVPLLVEEVLEAHLQTGSVWGDDRGAHWRRGQIAVPGTVAALVERRLERLSPAARAIIVAGAVLSDFDPRLLGAMTGEDERAVGDAIIEAVDAGLLESVRGAVEFRHAVMGDAVTVLALPHQLASLHARAAATLAAAPNQDATSMERQARHLAHAGEADQAAGLLLAAAGVVLEDHALLRAEELAREAGSLGRGPEVRDRASDQLASVLAAQGRWADALALDRAACEQGRETPARRLRMARCALDARLVDEARRLTARAMQQGDNSPLLPVLVGRVALSDGDAEAALACAAGALSAAEAAGDGDARFAALDLQGRAFDFAGRRADAALTYERQAEAADAAGRLGDRLHALVSLGELELLAGSPPRRIVEARDLARTAGALVEQAWAEMNLSMALTLQGDPAAGAEVAAAAARRCRELRLDVLPFLLACQAGAEMWLGRDTTTALLSEAKALAPQATDLQMFASGITADGALHRGEYDDAIVHHRAAWEVTKGSPGGTPTDSAQYLAIAQIAAGRDEEATRVLDEAALAPDLDRWHSRPVLMRAARALLARDAGGIDAAIASATGRMPVDLALLRVIAAEVIDGSPRARWLREALDLYEACGAAIGVDRVRRLLREAGGAVPRRGGRPVPRGLMARGVTAREVEVLQLLGERQTNAVIAERLYISVRTVESHVSSLLAKLEVGSRDQLAAFAPTCEPGLDQTPSADH